jgi:hypothetical protein
LSPQRGSPSSSQSSPEHRSLIYILISAFAFLFAWSFSRSRSQRAKNYVDTIRDSDKTNSQYEYPPPKIEMRAELYTSEHIERQRTKDHRSSHRVQISLMIATWLTFIAAAVYAGISLKMWREMGKQTGIASDQFEANTRPWIKITNIELRAGVGAIKTLMFHWPITGAEAPPMIQAHVTFDNVGHSAARDVEIQSELFFGKFAGDTWHNVVTREQQIFCKSVAGRTPGDAAVIVFPSDTFIHRRIPY